ncbi:hypothetical protein PGB90_010101 [Kerria lacca]
MEFSPDEHQHIRYNPLKDEWILVSPHRMKRPWKGQVEPPTEEEIPEFDQKNPLSPGVIRPNGQKTEDYTSTYVFDNDFPALYAESVDPPEVTDPLFQIAPGKGICRVMCFHPKSNITVPLMTISELKDVIDTWIEQFEDLGKCYTWVQIFENKGAMVGCSNPHPHCQIWASMFYPNEPRIKDFHQKQYFEKFKKPLLMDYVQKEINKKVRIVIENSDWVVLVPFWAMWPYETMVLPKTHILRINDLNEKQRVSLATAMKQITTKYDNLFKTSFPYSMGWHGAPTGCKYNENLNHWVFHGVYYPPLLRSANVRKFMTGYEMLACPQRDLTPEKAAEQLRSQPDIHYKNKF